VQVAAARLVAERVEHKHGDVHIKLLTVFSNTKVAAVHGACGRAQAGAAGVFKLLAWFEEWLMAHYAKAFDFFVRAVGVVHIPGARDELRRHIAHVRDGDGVGKHVQAAVGGGLLRQVLRLNFDLEFVAWHGVILA